MYLENIVFDAFDPQSLGRLWEPMLGTEPLTDEAAGYETRLTVSDDLVLDLCFQKVPAPPVGPQRLRFELRAPDGAEALAERLLGLGARRADGQGQVSGLGLVDPEGNPFLVTDEQAYDGSGPVAALSLEVADPDRDRDFWQWLTGWVPAEEGGSRGLRHPSRQGPLLALRPRQLRRRPARTGSTSTFGWKPVTTPNPWFGASPSAAVGSSTWAGATCPGGTSPTRPATSSACCPRAAEVPTDVARETST